MRDRVCRYDVGRAALNLIYPPRCPFCDAVLGQLAECPACAGAERALRRMPPRLAQGDWMLAGLSGAGAAYRYDGVAREAVLRLKYAGRACYAPDLAARMAGQLFGCTFSGGGGIITAERPRRVAFRGSAAPFARHGAAAFPPFAARSARPDRARGGRPPVALEYDCVVPVPASGRRAYNPPGLLAKELARALELPLETAALYKARPTPRQEELNRAGRLRNLMGAFAVRPGRLPENSRVLLVDDVVTTGATLSACALALLRAGAGEVFAVCFAATPPDVPAAGPEK